MVLASGLFVVVRRRCERGFAVPAVVVVEVVWVLVVVVVWVRLSVPLDLGQVGSLDPAALALCRSPRVVDVLPHEGEIDECEVCSEVGLQKGRLPVA